MMDLLARGDKEAGIEGGGEAKQDINNGATPLDLPRAPLTDLLKKNCAWEWSDVCQAAFKRLKAAVTEEPILALPDFTKAFETRLG
uniref:Reverse transcriptase/retrotransposon-derived protein RNase H-like domain-containing protein n=1 Tax=Solanum lycopersicum TaxID=4081 RepID=A0A3Q7I306_SOLLC